MADSKEHDGDGIKVPFVFVRRGDPQPSEWMARHPGWVSFPATLVMRPEPRLVSLPRSPAREPGTGLGEAFGFRPGSRPAAQGAPLVRRRKVPVNRLPTGPLDAEHPVAAYLRISEAMDVGASTYLASTFAGVGAAERVSAGHGASNTSGRTPETGAEHHGQAHHLSMARAHPRYTPISEEAASEITDALADPKVRAFLRLLSFEEFDRERDENYRTRFGDLKGRDPITDHNMLNYKPKNMGSDEKPHTAGGAYQIQREAYEEAVGRKVAADFLPASQDRIAVHLLYERHALQAVTNHDMDQAFALLKGTWSSLPGGIGVKERLDDVKRRYERYLAEENSNTTGSKP